MGRILGYYYDYVQYVGRINGGGSKANKDFLIVHNASTVPCLSIVPFPLLRLESRTNLNSMLGGIVLLKIFQFPTCHEDMVVFCISSATKVKSNMPGCINNKAHPCFSKKSKYCQLSGIRILAADKVLAR